MKRREFSSLIGGAAAAWPLAVRAQQTERMRRIGVLMYRTAGNPGLMGSVGEFLQGLPGIGRVVRRHMEIDYRWDASDADRARRAAAELVALAPDVILVATGVNTGVLLQTTRTVPIVFVNAIDPVGAGLVASLARPGGNATGFASREFSL